MSQQPVAPALDSIGNAEDVLVTAPADSRYREKYENILYGHRGGVKGCARFVQLKNTPHTGFL